MTKDPINPLCEISEKLWVNEAEEIASRRLVQEKGEEPLPLYRDPIEPADFPLTCLGEILGAAVDAICDIVQCPPEIAAQSVLVAAAVAVQGHVNVAIPATGQQKPVSLFAITVAASGERKSAADGFALAPIRAHEKWLREKYTSELPAYLNAKEAWDKFRQDTLTKHKRNYEAARMALAAMPPEPRAPLAPIIVCSEPTPEGLHKLYRDGQPSMGLLSDEGGSFINGHAMNKETVLRTAAGLSRLWDGTPIDRVRAGDGASVLPGRRLSVHLMCQPEASKRMLADRVLEDQGLLSRILVTAPASAAGTRFQRPQSPSSAMALSRYGEAIDALLKAPMNLVDGSINELAPRVIPFSAEAADTWHEFADYVERFLGPGCPFESIRGFANKMPEHAARLAAVLTLVEDPYASLIDVSHIEGGCVLAEYYAWESVRLFGVRSVPLELDQAEQLRRWLMEYYHEDIIDARNAVQYGPNALRDTATVKSAIAILVEHGWLIPNGRAEIKGKTSKHTWRIIRGDRG